MDKTVICTLLLAVPLCCAQFAPNDDENMYDIHFPEGNEFVAQINDSIKFRIELEDPNGNLDASKGFKTLLCKDGICETQPSHMLKNTTVVIIKCDLTIKASNFYGTWGLHVNNYKTNNPPISAHVHIIDALKLKKKQTGDILWCHESETLNYLKLDNPPECPMPRKKHAYVETGSLTVYVDNYQVQSQPAWTCKLLVHRVRLKCVHLQQIPEPLSDSIEPVDVEVCRQWFTKKSCEYGNMESFGEGSSWKTDNALKISYNHWFSVCGVGGKPRYFTSRNCLMDRVPITYQAPFVNLFSAATGTLPLTALATHGMKTPFKTIAWSPKSSQAFKHVCRKTISFTSRVTRTIYVDINAASHHKALHGYTVPDNNTVYQFLSTDKQAVLYVAYEKDRTTLKALHAGHCGDEYRDTFTSNSLVLQFVSDSYLALSKTARYTGVTHHPTMIDYHDDHRYSSASKHVNLWRTADASDLLICDVANITSETHFCHNGTAQPRTRRKRKATLHELLDITQARLDYLEHKQAEYSAEVARQLTYQSCIEQRRIHFLQTMQLNIDPSATFSSYTKSAVHVVPRGDLHSLQHCVRLDCATIEVVPSLETTYSPLRKVYEDKGVFISERLVFSRPIIQFTHAGQTLTAQLQTKHYVNPHLTFVNRCNRKGRGSLENAVIDVKFFEICGQYYIFEENRLVSTVKVAEAGSEQHIIREYKEKRATYRESSNSSVSTNSSSSMLIKAFATFAPVHLEVPEAAFYGLRKSSYFTQDIIFSQVRTLQEAIAATVRLQDAMMYTEAKIGREHIHSTVNTMGDIIGGMRDASIGAGKAIGDFVGSTIGSGTGMIAKSFADKASKGIATLMKSLFWLVFEIIGIIGGYWAIVATCIFLMIIRRHRKSNQADSNCQASRNDCWNGW